ncbi:MAG: 2-oxoisovalerate dehydrogenase [Ignavibacteriae bacterium]|nr:2-oxoisovalerate dehydrogenase [Ignavibacteria bacterium]MBI3363654.1 2-oxoisovalerate dehydrogenase [Ignavibacteriota bacterium]
MAQKEVNTKTKVQKPELEPLSDNGISVHTKTLQRWYQLLHLGRLLDQKAATYVRQAKGWSYHSSCAGHEGIQLILGLSFRQGKDFLFPYYRDLMTSLSAGLSVQEIIANGLSKATDVGSGGRHMSNHFSKPSIRIQNVSSATGNHALHAVGVARAIKKYGGDELAFASFGDSAVSEGFVYEAVSGAAREILPVIFVIQNNKFGISVPIDEQAANKVVAENFRGFKSVKIVKVDGTNVFDSWRGMQEALDYVKSGEGPAIVHADCVRINSHSNSDRQELYRSPEEIAEAQRFDPVRRLRSYLLSHDELSEEEITHIESENSRLVEDAATEVEAQPEPDPATAMQYVLPPVYERAQEDAPAQAPADAPTLTLREAINETLKEEFRRNPNTFLWGQDVASHEKGGVFNVTKGMLQEFGNERIFNAPIAEDFIVGTADGFARYRDDICVVIEGAQFVDYFWPAMEQLVEISHEYYRTLGQFTPNVVIRLASGGYIGGGLYHSQSLDATFATIPGLRIVMPSFADDAIGLMRMSMRSKGPTIFIENKFLYNQFFTKTPRPTPDHVVPFGKARVRREGNDLTIIAWGTPVHFALRVAAKLADEHGVQAEVIDLRSINPLDVDAILTSVKKTGRLLVAHEHPLFGGFGGEIASLVAEQAFQYLDAPVMRVASKNSPVPFARVLERAVLVQEEDILQAAVKLAGF